MVPFSRRRFAVVALASALALAAGCGSETVHLAPGNPTVVPLDGIAPEALQLDSPYSWQAGQAAMPCRAHYDFAAPLDDVDCTFQAVDGAHEWKMLCPAHKYLPVEDDLKFDDAGTLIGETLLRAPAPIDDGRTVNLGLTSLNAPPCTVLETNAAGKPTKAHCQLSDFTLPDGTPVTGDRIVTRGYDDRGRFTLEASIEADTYIIDSEVLVNYDDAAGRRDVENRFFPGHTISIRDTRSDVFDADLRLVERTIERSGITTVYTYEYDDMDRVTKLSAAITGDVQNAPTSYVAQRSFDCH